MTEAQERSDHRQVEDKHAFRTDLAYKPSNLGVTGGSWDHAERVLYCSTGTSWLLDSKMI